MIKILGLQYKRKYDTDEDFKSLRYGKVMVMADQVLIVLLSLNLYNDSAGSRRFAHQRSCHQLHSLQLAVADPTQFCRTVHHADR
jgi:hypothetical protein